MEDLDYQPNLLAGSLRKKRTGTIGLIIPDSSNMLFAHMSKKLEDVFFEKKYNIIVCNSSYDVRREIEHLRTLRSKMVDGILMVPASGEGGHILGIKEAGIPIILLDRKIYGVDVDYILADNHRAGYLAGRHLIGLGHSDIGYIDRAFPHYHSTKRKEGLQEALSEAGLELGGSIVKGGFTYREGADAAAEMMEKNREVTAIFAFNDINALGAIRGLTDIGFRVPEDISVMGNDDIKLGEAFIPGLTTIHYPVEEMAEKAAGILLERIGQPGSGDLKEIILKTDIIIRESTAARR